MRADLPLLRTSPAPHGRRRAAQWLWAAAALAGLTVRSGGGFALRTAQPLPFQTIAVTPERGAGVAGELSRYLGGSLRPVAPPQGGAVPEVILDILQETRQKVIVGVTTSGQVREYELRLKVLFRLRSSKGAELIAPATIEQVTSISFNESAVLAKEAEEALLYRDMQSDIVQQLLRRLAKVRLPDAVVPPLAAASQPALLPPLAPSAPSAPPAAAVDATH